MIGSALAHGAQGLQIGGSLRFGLRDWTIVGVFSGGNSGFDSEIWGDAEQMMQAFRRQAYSSAVIHLTDASSFEVFKRAVAQQPRLKVEIKRESQFYADQSQQLANFISILGQTITAIFSIGAIIGAMITMYASVANRTREIGTLRALGFGRGTILSAFLKEAILLGLVSGVIGLAAASMMQWLKISTTNFQTFSEIVFSLILTPKIALEVLLFAVFMGVLGGFLPALRAARLEIVDALRAV
jgi:ABC-type transport system, involved in lipoprotein release, permease component